MPLRKGIKEEADTAPPRGDELSSEHMLPCLYLFTLCLYLSLSRSRGLPACSSVQMEPSMSPDRVKEVRTPWYLPSSMPFLVES